MELHVLALLQCLYTCTYCLLVTYEVFVVPKQMNSTVCHQWHYWLVTSPVCCCSATVLFPREITAVAATHMFHLVFNRRSKKDQSITKKSRYKEMFGFQSEKMPKQRGTNPYCEFPPAIGRSSGKVSFHGKFPDYYPDPTINTIPTSFLLLSHGRKLNCKEENKQNQRSIVN